MKISKCNLKQVTVTETPGTHPIITGHYPRCEHQIESYAVTIDQIKVKICDKLNNHCIYKETLEFNKD